MAYIIYDTNEYLKIGGKKHQSFDEVISRVDDLRDCEKRKSLCPIFNTTVAFELISHLMTNKTTTRNRYIRACYALYYHCLTRDVVVTKNPAVAYFENLFGIEKQVVRTINFLEELYRNPSVRTIEKNRGLIVEIMQYTHGVQSSWLHDLRSIRKKDQFKKGEKTRTIEFIKSADYPAWRAFVFLESVLRAFPVKVDRYSIINDNAIKNFIEQHQTYIEIWRRFDETYISGKYKLDDDKTANRFWDAEICYYVGTKINDSIVCIATEANMIHTASQKANQGALLLKKCQIIS